MNPMEITALQEVLTTLIIMGGLLTGVWMWRKTRRPHGLLELDELARSVEDLSGEVRQLRAELGEAQDRLDFTERLLARGSVGGTEPRA